jgi:long-chain acyl-CoA synthetase
MSTKSLKALERRREVHFGDRVVWCFTERLPSVYSGFEKAARENPLGVALRFGENAWTYTELEQEVARVASGISKHGVRPGDRVAMQVGNRPEFVFIFFAIQRLGAVSVPMDVRLQGAEVGHVLADSGAKVFLHDKELADRLIDARVHAGEVLAISLPDASEGTLFSEARGNEAPSPFSVEDEESVAMILYTSGTTGKPKGAAIAHLNVVHSIVHHAGNLGLTPDDRSLVAVPLSHITGLLCGVLAPLCTGGTLILLPYFKAREFLPMAAQTRMTYTIMVPAMYNLCLRVENFESFDLSSWRIGHFGGSPMPQATIDALAEKLPGLQLVNGYGATEVCSPAAMWPVGQAPIPISAVGLPMPCAEVLIMDPETGTEVPTGTSGEVWVRGPMVIKEYWNNPEATAKGIVAGFWRSGDIGSIDGDGNLYVHDRLKDVINRAGYKIYSAEVEGVLLQCPGVVEAAVVAKADPVLGERVHAFVSVSHVLDESQITAFCSGLLADYKVPESWTIDPNPLPRTATSKVDKKSLRALIASSHN